MTETFPISQIMRNGQSDRQPFNITLVSCGLEKPHPELDDWRYFEVTFDGREDAGYFAIDGSARGISLQISDESGNIAVPGAPMAKGGNRTGEMTFNYGLRLVKNHQVLKLGEYTSTVRFKMDYY